MFNFLHRACAAKPVNAAVSSAGAARSFFTKSSTMRAQDIIGIDLGTTNSCVAIMEGTSLRVMENSEGARTTPSIVAFAADGQKIVGAAARRQSVTNPANTFYATKRLIGRRFDDAIVQKESKMVPYKIVASPSGDAWVADTKGNKYSPQQVGAFVLSKMKETAETYLGRSVSKAVVTCPAYFNDSQRQATKDAGRIAGLDVVRIINEPTAAALSFGLDKKQNKTIAVYDLGGGTFDISVLELSQGVFEVKSTNGDTFLGGEDFDNLLVDFLLNDFKATSGIDLSKDKLAVQRLREAAEKAKRDLDALSQVEVNLPYITTQNGQPVHLSKVITRTSFESLVEPLVQRSIGPVQKCLKDAQMNPWDVDECILVGGMTRMPRVQKEVEKLFRKPANKTVNPDEAVALGAAIQGAVLAGSVKDIVLVDVTPLSLGTQAVNDVFVILIPRNSPIPTKKSKSFTTMMDNQHTVAFPVYQGERAIASENKLLGEFALHNIPPARRGVPSFNVTFDIDANGILKVTARDVGTGQEHQLTVNTSGGLTEAEINRMRDDALRHEARDKKFAEMAAMKNEADRMLYSTESSLEEHSSKMTPEDAQKIRDQVSKLRTAFESDDMEKLKAEIEETRKAAATIGDAIYKNAKK